MKKPRHYRGLHHRKHAVFLGMYLKGKHACKPSSVLLCCKRHLPVNGTQKVALWAPCLARWSGNHLSRPTVASKLKRPTRVRGGPPHVHSYPVLLRVGFT